MSNIKVRRSVELIEDVDIELPIYAIVESDEHTSYVRIDDDTFTEIKVGHISFEICKFKNNNSVVNEIWIKNQCTKEEWMQQYEHIKEFIDLL